MRHESAKTLSLATSSSDGTFTNLPNQHVTPGMALCISQPEGAIAAQLLTSESDWHGINPLETLEMLGSKRHFL